MKKLLLSSFFPFLFLFAHSQCVINSTCGYTVTISISPVLIIPSANPCPFGYNYNVQFNYSIQVSGTNNCFNGNIGIQPQILCGSDNNGYFTINVPAPTVGAGASTVTYTGTQTTTTNPFRSTPDCATATPSSLGCNNVNITIFGPGISTTTISCAALITLPVKLESFNGKLVNKAAVLNWVTAQEIDNERFEVEHSTDGQMFTVIGTVAGGGNTSSRSQYTFTHTQPDAGVNFYRIKSVDYSNKSAYSSIITLHNKISRNFYAYPVPASHSLVVVARNGQMVNLYNMAGKLIMPLHNGENDISRLAAGVYFAKSGEEVIRVIKE